MKAKNNQDEGFTLEIDGDSFVATGNGFVYIGQGECRKFTQSKKLPSIRIVKSLVKALVGQSCMK
jgi:hypothetical protein